MIRDLWLWLMIPTLILSSVSVTKTQTEGPDTPTPDPAEPVMPIDQDNTGFVAIPERGLLLERTGTLITHASYEVATFILQIEKVNFTDLHWKLAGDCNNDLALQLKQIELNYEGELSQLKASYDAIVASETQLKSSRLCEALQLNGSRCSQVPDRQKRFIVGAAALATAGTALDLSLQSERQIKEIRKTLQAQEHDLYEIKDTLARRIAYQDRVNDHLVESLGNLFGYVRGLQEQVNRIPDLFNCWTQQNFAFRAAEKSIQQVREMLQFVLQGQLSGRLTPSLLSVEEINHIAEISLGYKSPVFYRYPHLLFQTATATLVEADFRNFQFQYIMLFPKLSQANISPFFAIRQVGFLAENSYDNHTTCLAFRTPPYAVIRHGRWYMLETPNQCPIFARAMICQNLQFNLINFEDCISTENFGASTCPLRTCPLGNHFISTPVGLLVRTNVSVIHIATLKKSAQNSFSPHVQTTSDLMQIHLPPYQVAFVKWNDEMSSVTVGSTAVHSPLDANPHAIMYRKPKVAQPHLMLKDWIQIPDVGAESIAEAIERFEKKVEALEEEKTELASNSSNPTLPNQPLRGTINTIKNIPRYIRIAGIVIATLLGLYLLKELKTCVAPNASLIPKCWKRKPSDRPRTVRFSEVTSEHEAGRLPRSESHISLVINSGDAHPSAPADKPVEPPPAVPYHSAPYHPIYPDTPASPDYVTMQYLPHNHPLTE